MLFKPGDIVTDNDEESVYKGKQGEVISCQLCFWSPPDVLVRFDQVIDPFSLEYDMCPNDLLVIYRPDQLVTNKDWKPELYARRLFGRHWRCVYAIKSQLDPTALCMVENCSAHQTKTAWFNIWGSVCNAHVCDTHAESYNGYCMDSFPWRKAGVA